MGVGSLTYDIPGVVLEIWPEYRDGFVGILRKYSKRACCIKANPSHHKRINPGLLKDLLTAVADCTPDVLRGLFLLAGKRLG